MERCIDRAREIEGAVLEDEKGLIRASLPGEIVQADKHGFYSYEAKYTYWQRREAYRSGHVSAEQQAHIQELAVQTFQVLGCGGLARVDFFLTGEEIFVNEVNTLPGFTSISMYPKLWEASGLLQPDLMVYSDRSRTLPSRAAAAQFDGEGCLSCPSPVRWRWL